MGHRRRKSVDSMRIPADIIPDILLRLPTKDFVRSSSVCKLWRSIVADPSTRKLRVAQHAAAVASLKPEVLLVTETGEPGRSDEASVFNLSSAKALCQVAIPKGYHLAGVCNDLLCFALDHDQAPPVVCNPVTGETLQLPKAPPLPTTCGSGLSNMFVLGFSPPTKEYKMFRLSFPRRAGSKDMNNYIAVYTLGGGGGWRQCSYLSRFHPIPQSRFDGDTFAGAAPVHIDGNIFVPTADVTDKRSRAARMLVLDVATETHRSYRIPYNYDDYHEAWSHQMLADGFDLNGQMCLAVNVDFYPQPRKITQFWVMKPLGEIEGKGDDDEELYWDLRYSFYFDDSFTLNRPRSAWIDEAQTLCYRVANSLCMYDTRSGGLSSSNHDDPLMFDKRLKLPDPPRCPSASYDGLEHCRWNICGGYRPSLLSPLIFALPPSQEKKRPQFEQTVLRALMVDLDGHACG